MFRIILQLKLLIWWFVGDYIKKIKTTFDFYFDLYTCFKQHGYTKHGNIEKLSIKKSALLLLVNL